MNCWPTAIGHTAIGAVAFLATARPAMAQQGAAANNQEKPLYLIAPGCCDGVMSVGPSTPHQSDVTILHVPAGSSIALPGGGKIIGPVTIRLHIDISGEQK